MTDDSETGEILKDLIRRYRYLLVGRGALAENVGLSTGMLQGTGQVHTSLQMAAQQGGSMEKRGH